jgi:four helix bundle protein
MATIDKFEDLEVWKAARKLANSIYDVTEMALFSKDFGLRDQIRRAAVSVLSNISEGFERGADTEFSHFLIIAKGSAGEVRAQLYIAKDRHYIGTADFDDVMEQAVCVSRQLSNLIAYLRRSTSSASKPSPTRPSRR